MALAIHLYQPSSQVYLPDYLEDFEEDFDDDFDDEFFGDEEIGRAHV